MCVCTYLWAYVCICMSVYVYISLCICICINIYTLYFSFFSPYLALSTYLSPPLRSHNPGRTQLIHKHTLFTYYILHLISITIPSGHFLMFHCLALSVFSDHRWPFGLPHRSLMLFIVHWFVLLTAIKDFQWFWSIAIDLGTDRRQRQVYIYAAEVITYEQRRTESLRLGVNSSQCFDDLKLYRK